MLLYAQTQREVMNAHVLLGLLGMEICVKVHIIYSHMIESGKLFG